MRVTNSTLAGLVLFFGLANAQTAYDNTCNPPPTGEKDVEPGVVATYGCGNIHDNGQYAGDQRITATPEECAKECDKRVPEGPCSWHGGKCYFYTAGAGDAAWPQAVTITTRKDWAKLKTAYDQCQTDKNKCLAGGGGGGGGGPPSVLPSNICEHGTKYNRQIVHSGPRSYEVWCDRIHHGTNDLGHDIPVKDANECIELCDKKKSPQPCVRAITTLDGKLCFLRSYGNKYVANDYSYNSFHLV